MKTLKNHREKSERVCHVQNHAYANKSRSTYVGYVCQLSNPVDDQRDKTIIILGSFNAQNTLWGKHINQYNKMGIILEELIQRHSLYVATDLDDAYQHSPNCHSFGKSTIDLILYRVINNLSVKTRKIWNRTQGHRN